MSENDTSQSSRLGLLDLSVDLSSSEIFANEEFSVYLHIKNPFDRPIWIHDVTMSLPSQMYWNKNQEKKVRVLQSIVVNAVVAFIRTYRTVLNSIRFKIRMPMAELSVMNSREEISDEKFVKAVQERSLRVQRLQKEIAQAGENGDSKRQELEAELVALVIDEQILYSRLGYDFLVVKDGAVLNNISIQSSRPIFVRIEGEKTHVKNIYSQALAEQNRVPLKGALPPGEALQPGNTDVWTILLGTNSNIFFMPSQYRLQFNVLYAFEPVITNKEDIRPKPSLFINTTARSLSIRASIWALMIGAFGGGILGALARELQLGNSSTAMEDANILVSILLSAILSVAAVIFASRKAETQSFISIEDFWGGMLIGFLIGYSGTTVFRDITSTSTQP